MAIEIGPALGLVADSGGVVKATDDLRDLSAAAGVADKSAQTLTTSTKKMAGGMSAGAYQARLAAQQLSQVAQQSMATGNFVQALAIQLPDLAGGFGAVGIAVGVVAGVALPLLVSAFTGTSSSAKEVKSSMDVLDDAFNTYMQYAENAAQTTSDLAEKFGGFASQVQGFSEYMAQVSLGAILTDAGAVIDSTVSGLTNVKTFYDQVVAAQAQADRILTAEGQSEAYLLATQAVEGYQEKLDAAAASVGLNVEGSLKLLAAMNEVKSADGMGDMAKKAGAAYDVMKSLVPLGYDLPAPLHQAAAALEQMSRSAAEASKTTVEMNRYLRDAAAAAASIIANAPGAGWLSGAISDASTLGATLWDAAMAASAARGGSVVNANPETGPGFERGGKNGSTAPTIVTPPTLDELIKKNTPKSGGSSKGGGAGNGVSDLDTLIEELRTEQETLDVWRAENLAKIAEYNDAELAAIGGRNEAKLRLETEYQERLKGILAAEQNYRLTETASMFDGLAAVAAAGGKKALRAQAV